MTNQYVCRDLIGPLQTRDDFIRNHLPHAMLRQRGRKRLRKKKAMTALKALWADGSRETQQHEWFAGQNLHEIIAAEVDTIISDYNVFARRRQTESTCLWFGDEW